jgi:hypothetical protein
LGKRVFIWNGKARKESKQTERQRESERVCECWSAPKIASVDIHKQRGIKKHIWFIFDGQHLWSISEDILGMIRNDVSHGRPDILIQIFEQTTIQERGTFLTLACSASLSREALLKDRLCIIFFPLLQNLNEEVNCTEPFPFSLRSLAEVLATAKTHIKMWFFFFTFRKSRGSSRSRN